jgi:uncharacterized protein YajQ (UPF0234 family)
MPSFDITSKLNSPEVDNALIQANKEIGTRYDFRNVPTELTREGSSLKLSSANDEKIKAMREVLYTKLVKRGVSLKHLEEQRSEPTPGGKVKQEIKLIEGIAQDKAKDIIRYIKDAKFKVQASIQADVVRVSGKDRDELQKVIAGVRQQDFPLELQFSNFRD